MSDQRSEKRTRREMLIAGAAGAAGLVSGSLPPAQAATSDPLILGQENVAATTTHLVARNEGGAVLHLSGKSNKTLNVRNNRPEGGGEAIAIQAVSEDRAVVGYSSDGAGVVGDTSQGYGVQAFASDGGTGLLAGAQDGEGIAMKVDGVMQFSHVGTVVIPRGEQSVQVDPGAIEVNTVLLATVQSEGAVLKAAVKLSEIGPFRIELVEPATQDVTVAYFGVDSLR